MAKNSAAKRKRGEESEEENEEESENEESGSENGSDNDDGSQDNNDDDDNDDEDEDEPEEDEKPKKRAKPTKKPAKSKASTKKPVKKAKSSQSSSSKKSKESDHKDQKPKSSKQMKKLERLEEARKAYKWWEAPKLSSGTNWLYLEHPGVNFPPPYIKHNIPLKYDGQPVQLNAEQEEIASFYAAMPLDGPQLGNAKTKPVFDSNFFEDFKASLGPGHIIKKFDKINFDEIRNHLNLEKSLRKAANDEEKQQKKLEKEQITERYGYALIDGRIEKMGNFNMEPPGLFRGRGEHPKTGKLKSRCFSEAVSLNLSEDSPIPKCTLPGHAWQSVRHDNQVTWLCQWNENVQNQNKYVMLAASSSFKGKSDMDKYTKAIRLLSHIDKVRKDYTSKIKQTKDRGDRQLGTAMWVIDVLALRVGGEKGEDEADTVGCCSLRVEHLKFNPDPNSYEIELEFLGKDSMLYKQNINFSLHGELGKLVYECLKSFCANKKPESDVFETLSPPDLNKHLNDLMKGLTAKVFRTFNASITLQRELPTAESLEGLSIQDKVAQYNAANRQVAILCNHQKTVSKAAETMFENLNEKLNTMKEQLRELIQWREWVVKGKENKIPLKDEDKDIIEELQEKQQQATQRKENAKSIQEKLDAAAALEEVKTALKQDQKRRMLEKHKYKTIPSESSLDSRITKWKEDIRKMEVDIRNRDENKEVALGTSKINYMDPRISVAWCKRCEVPIDKIFAKTLRDKFNWAMAVPPDWKFK